MRSRFFIPPVGTVGAVEQTPIPQPDQGAGGQVQPPPANIDATPDMVIRAVDSLQDQIHRQQVQAYNEARRILIESNDPALLRRAAGLSPRALFDIINTGVRRGSFSAFVDGAYQGLIMPGGVAGLLTIFALAISDQKRFDANRALKWGLVAMLGFGVAFGASEVARNSTYQKQILNDTSVQVVNKIKRIAPDILTRIGL